jgi:thiamine transport system permease protein
MPPSPLARLAGACALVALALGIGVPWWALLREAGDPQGWRVLLEARVWERLGWTLWQATASTLLALALGLPAAIAFGLARVPGARWWRAAFTVPFVMPSVVAGLAVLAWFGPRGLSGLDLRDSLAIVLIAHAVYNVGVVVRVVGGALEALAPRLHEAAAVLGSPPWRRTLRVTLPLAAPAALSAATLVFLFCFTSFGVILVLAPAPAFATLEVEIYRAVARRADVTEAAALATLQLLVVMAATVLYTRAQQRLAARLPRSATPAPPARTALGRFGVVAALSLAAAVTLLPPAALLLQALWPAGAVAPDLSAFVRLARPSEVIGLTDLRTALVNSLWVAAAATGLALAFGAAAAYGIARAGMRWLDALTLLPLATSAVTLGLGVLLAYPSLAAAPLALPLAHALLASPFVVRSLVPAWRALEAGQAQAAASLGASPWRTLRRVELPQLAPALLTATGFAAAVSLGEFGAALVLRRPETATLPVALFERLGRPGAARFEEALAIAALLLVLTGLVVLLGEVLARRRRGSGGGVEF